MNSFLSEYGRFIVAIVCLIFLFGIGSFLINGFREYSVTYIQAITGVENTNYNQINWLTYDNGG